MYLSKDQQPKFLSICQILGISARISIGAAMLVPLANAGNTWIGGTAGFEQDWNKDTNWGTAFPLPTENAIINVATGNFAIITADSAFTPVDIIVGTAGNSGRLDQRAGTVATGNNNWLFVGQGNNGNGTYNLADTAVTTGPGVGSLTGYGAGAGSINVGGPTTTTGGRLVVGDGGTSIGNFNMNTSGTLKMEENALGMILGNGGSSSGNFRLDGGTVQINSTSNTGIALLVGTNGGDGSFRMSGGSVNATGAIWAGDNNANSQGLIEVTGGSFSASANGTGTQQGQHSIGRGIGQGTLSVGGTGSVSLTGLTHIGYSGTTTAGTSGTLSVTGGSFTNTGELRVGSGVSGNGVAAVGSGLFNVSAGTALVTGNLRIASGNDNTDLVTGTTNLSGSGTLNVAGDLVLGYAGNNNLGKLTLADNAIVNVGTTGKRWLIVSQYDTSRGQLDISGGNLRLLNGTDIRFTTGNTGTNSTNVINQTGGAVTFYSDGGTTLGGGILDLQTSGAAGVNNTYNLDGGTLTVSAIGSS